MDDSVSGIIGRGRRRIYVEGTTPLESSPNILTGQDAEDFAMLKGIETTIAECNPAQFPELLNSINTILKRQSSDARTVAAEALKLQRDIHNRQQGEQQIES